MRSITRAFSCVLSLVALVAVGAVAFAGSAAHAANPQSAYQASRGHLAPYTHVAPTHLAAASSQTTHTQHTMPLRLPNGKSVSPAAKAAASAPKTTSTAVASAGTLYHNFDGIDAIQSSAANKGLDIEPPDEGLGAGNGYVVNLVNLAGAIYRTNGTMLAGPFTLSQFFGEPPAFANGVLISDPRVYYDRSTHTWFATELEFTANKTTTESHLDLAVNTSGNPMTAWTIYRISTTDTAGYACPCFADYPIFGIDQYNVYIVGQEFSILQNAYNGSEIFAISKSQLEAGTAANFVRFGSLSLGGALTYHIQPAISYSSAPAEYFMESLDPNGTFDNRLGVFALTNRQAVTSGVGMPTLSSVVIHSETYGFPVNAQTPPGYNFGVGQPTTGVVTPDFDAMEEVQYLDGKLVSALNTSVTIPGDTSTRDGIAWFQVTPHLSGNVISTATAVTRQGYLSSRGLYLLYPHINQGTDGALAIVFSLGGPNTFLSAAYSVMPAGGKYFTGIHVPGPGVAPDNGFTLTAKYGGVGRWGDYSNGELNPTNNTLWLATQYIPNNGDQFTNWGNRIFEIQL